MLHAGIMVRDLPKKSYWSLGGIGDFQLRMNSLAIAMGGGVRIGLEDNIWYDSKRTKLAKNVDLLKRIHVFLKMHDKEVMSSKFLRENLLKF